jgi:hypothetical protein
MSRRASYGIALLVAGIVTAIVFVPSIRQFVWPGVAWSIFIMSAIVAIVVFGNILAVLYYMYTGYGPEGRDLERKSANMQKEMLRLGSNTASDETRRVA